MMNQINVKLIREFQEYYLANAPFGSNNKNRLRSNPRAGWLKYQENLSTFFRWAVKRELMIENFASDSDFKFKIEDKVPEIFTHEELEKLFDYFDFIDTTRKIPYISTAFRFLAYTGSRPGEMWGCKWSQVDFKNMVIRFVSTKTKKDRTIPMSDKLKPYLERLPRNTTYVFDDGKGDLYMRESGWWKILDRALKDLGLWDMEKPRNLYTFRHTFAANLCLAGVPLSIIKTLMGHDNIQTTMRYAEHFYVDDRKNAITKLPY
jgi:integrase/recombinase XerC